MATCHSCGHDNPDSAQYCGSCGAPLGTAPGAREERKVVTILFCDLVEFTSRFDRADPEDVRATLATYHDRVRREIERFGGTVEKFIGDAVMAVYGAPAAHEDDAQRALLSALRIPLAIEELNQSNLDLPLAVRIGVETGEVVVSVGAERSGHGMVIGDVVNTASRLQTVAPTGGIVVGEGTFRLTRDLFEYEAREPVQVKGKADRLHIWVAKGARSRFGADLQHRTSTPMVDREDELELLKRTFARAVREPSVQLVTLMGEPGVGKSRVVREFFTYLDDRPDLVIWRQGRCLPYGEGVSFWALGGIVKAQAGILESDGAREANEKLSDAVDAIVEEATEREWIRHRLAPLIGAESHTEGVDRAEAFSAWRRFLETMATTYPLVIAIEDLHWADGAMLEFIEHVADWSGGLPILILCTARPELFERDPRWGGGKRNSSIVSLAPLTGAETERLVASLLPAGSPQEVRDLLFDRTGGNPLFAEEYARMLNERADHADAEPSEGLPLRTGSPDSLQAIIAARLDALTIEQKSLLQDASVIGKEFWPGALAAIGGTDAEPVRSELHELARKELVRRSRISSVEHETEYSFAHTLIRDVAYGQIPRLPRARKHVAAAEWLERLAGERVADHAELLAHHYGQALELSRAAGRSDQIEALEESTRRSWIAAGERAMGLDVSRAEVCFTNALDLFPAAHPDRTQVLARIGEAALDGGRYDEAGRTLEEAIAELRDRGDRVRLGSCLTLLATVLWDRGDTAACRERLAEAVEILEGELPGPELADCYASVASDRLIVGYMAEAVEWADRSLELATTLAADARVPRALSFRGMARCYGGDLEGLKDLDEALVGAERHGLSREHAQVLVMQAEVRWSTEGPNEALQITREGIDLAERRGVVDMAVACRTLSLGPLFDLGRWDELLEVADGMTRWSGATGGAYTRVMAQTRTAQVQMWRGGATGASTLGSDVLSRAKEIGDPQVLVPATVAAALVAERRGRSDEAVQLIEDLDRAVGISIDWYREEFLGELVRICTAGGNLSLAASLLDRARVFTLRQRLSLLSARAALEEATGREEEASGIYAEAAHGWSRYGHPFETGLALLGQGRCLSRAGRPGSAERFADARQRFAGLGAELLVAEVDAIAGATS